MNGRVEVGGLIIDWSHLESLDDGFIWRVDKVEQAQDSDLDMLDLINALDSQHEEIDIAVRAQYRANAEQALTESTIDNAENNRI